MRAYLSFVVVFAIHYGVAFAQLTSSENTAKPYIPSWDTYEFMKYGNVGASLYTGTINYSVPIYEYEDEDFNYGISIDYATNGFRVNHKSGFLGHGWSLNFPGIITREIKGLADDDAKTIIARGGNGCQLYGYDKMPIGRLNSCILVHYSGNEAFTAMTDASNVSYDAQPDIYRFNFCGYSGSFRRMPSSDGKSFLFFDCPSKSKSLKIEGLTNNSIVIVDGLGYKYSFTIGEYTKSTYNEAVGAPLERRIRQWNLQKVTAPNGRTMEFIYSHISDNGGLDKSEHNVTYTPSLSYVFSYYAGTDEGYGSKDATIYESDNFSTKLTGIKFPDGTRACIEYADGVKELRYVLPNGDTREAYGENKKIRTIMIYSPEGNPIKKADFSYLTVGGNASKENRLTFLKTIDISGQGIFSFEYNRMTACPPLGTIKSDHWGYYNGEYGGFSTKKLLSNLTFDSEYNELYTSNFRRSPDFQSALSGTLNKICYSTGGYSTISYEPHDCSQKVERTSSTLFLPTLIDLPQNETVGGVRVKQVTTFMPNGTPSDTVRYEYKSENDPSLSSGILINTPRYGIKYITPNNKAVERFNLCNSIYDFTQTHIEYSNVREYRSNAGHTDYFYSTYKDYPDGADVEDDKENRQPLFGYYTQQGGQDMVSFFNNPNHLVENLLTPIASAQTKRGLLTSMKRYSGSGDLVSETKYSYQFPLVKIDTVFTLTGEVAKNVFYPRYNIELSCVEDASFFGKTSVVNKKSSVLNSYGMETESTFVTSEGNTIVDTYQYSGDVQDADNLVKNMRLFHNVNSLLSHERKAVTNGKETFIWKKRYNYYQPDLKNETLFKVANIEDWNPSNGWKSKISYVHDKNGRILQQTDSSGVCTSYLWGYKGKYPLMVAKNASIPQLEKAVTAQGLNISALSDAISYTDLTFDQLLASTSSLPSSIVDIYKFKPNFGLTGHTMPNTLKTYYSYDGYGRLVSEADYKHRVLKQGEYNIVSVTSLAATMSCPDTYVDEPMNVMVTANGGTHSYKFAFKIYDKLNNAIVYKTASNNGAIDITPNKNGISSNYYRVECEVSDTISGEKDFLSQEFFIKPARLQFSNIEKQFTYTSGSNEVCIANIYTDTPTDVTFGLDLVSTEACTITIANTTFLTKREKDKEFVVRLLPGNNIVKMAFPSSTAIFEADLWMKKATNGHEIGASNIISVTY